MVVGLTEMVTVGIGGGLLCPPPHASSVRATNAAAAAGLVCRVRKL